MASLLKGNKHMKFHIGGGGPELQRIQELIQQQGLSEKIKIWGEVEDPEAFITKMDMLLLTSHREVFPMVVLEAMAVGTPMISIDVGGVKEAIADGDTGYLIPTYSPQAFAEKLRRCTPSKNKNSGLPKELEKS
ncbi:glycosyltransferase [Priestia megaterium]